MKAQARLFKLFIFAISSLLIAIYHFSTRQVDAFSSGPPASRTGAPDEETCVVCHDSFALNSGPGRLTLSGLPVGYLPDQEITVTVTLTQADRARYGFQLTALDDSGRQAGSFIVTDSARTQTSSGTVRGNARSYINHTSDGTFPSGTDQGSWSFKWRAPANSAGKVTFYVAGNAANGNGATSGDYIYTTTASIFPAVTSVSAASFASEAALASEAIAAAFGPALATATAGASALPLPTKLAGTEVLVKDSRGTERSAPLFFVSPMQVNYLIPQDTLIGPATVTIKSGDGSVSMGTVLIERVAPGVFSANANGQGVAAAVILRVRADGSQQYEPVAQFDTAQGRFVSVPINLGPTTDQVFLVLFGTGIRFFSSLEAITAKVGGLDMEVVGAAAQPDFVGLDQVNIRLKPELAGRGEVDVSLTVDGKTANTVRINIQ